MKCNKADVYLARQKSSYMHHIGFLCSCSSDFLVFPSISLLYRHCYEILYSEPWLSLVSGPDCTAWPTNVLEGQ